ncbi:MAG TPA: efflux RND transporter periplasmic adaptor subunit [Bryobacteraceae bacterium]|nr:efflux RND transporter periplasmic adaptor subunit [Bryobacteraceae bacterium]
MSRSRYPAGSCSPAQLSVPLWAAVPLALCAALGYGCKEKKVESAPPPPPEVEVLQVRPQDVPITKEWVSTLKGLVNSDIRSKVSGYLLKQDYVNGSTVAKGTLLFQVDPRPFQAAVDQAKANLETARGAVEQARAQLLQAKADQQKTEADLGKTQNDVTRFTPLAKAKAISQQELDNAVQANLAAKAQVEAAKASVTTASATIDARSSAVVAAQAALDDAQLNLGFTRIVSPIAGIAGIANAQLGDLVGPQTPTPLTTVSTANPILAQFAASEQEYLSAVRGTGKGASGARAALKNLVFNLILADGSAFPQKGRLQYVDREVDVRTGTINMQVAFPNPGNVLRPGGYGTVRAVVRTQKGALAVPQRALSDLQGRYMLAVVGDQDKVTLRQVKPGEQVGSLWVIREGLKPGERVVVEGIQKVKEGMQVVAKPYQPAAEKATN